ncbi:hypothetical protein PshuTeo2_43550 [Pseudomonas hunanensis]|uniref:Wzz/FepE/Etk N-terminal domain-containing protein n=1 Tax=Pseudomonas hunanensis TaxID=1247546 RepID=UPI002AA0D423|nr:Wzz/FepE/Etk N-terminal domain-containing protein [Pseudomonas hunanensis]MDY7074178.1 hypothetical protein [Pseudomonas hunanensis]
MRNERERLSGSDEIDLIELVQGVWRQKVWVVLVAVPVIALGLAYVMLVSPVYEAGSVRFFVCGPVTACRQAGPDFHQVGLMNRSPYKIAN